MQAKFVRAYEMDGQCQLHLEALHMSDSQSQVTEPIYSDLAQSDPDFAEIVELFVDGLTQRLAAS